MPVFNAQTGRWERDAPYTAPSWGAANAASQRDIYENYRPVRDIDAWVARGNDAEENRKAGMVGRRRGIDAQGRPWTDYTNVRGLGGRGFEYLSPTQYQGMSAMPQDDSPWYRSAPQWNQDKGEWHTPLNKTNLLNAFTLAAITGGGANAYMAGSGVAGVAPTAAPAGGTSAGMYGPGLYAPTATPSGLMAPGGGGGGTMATLMDLLKTPGVGQIGRGLIDYFAGKQQSGTALSGAEIQAAAALEAAQLTQAGLDRQLNYLKEQDILTLEEARRIEKSNWALGQYEAEQGVASAADEWANRLGLAGYQGDMAWGESKADRFNTRAELMAQLMTDQERHAATQRRVGYVGELTGLPRRFISPTILPVGLQQPGRPSLPEVVSTAGDIPYPGYNQPPTLA